MSGPQISRVTGDSATRGWWEVSTAAHDADFVGLPGHSLGEIKTLLSPLHQDVETELWLGTAADQPVVAGRLVLPLRDNLSAADVDVMTHPDHRLRGYGRAMFDVLVERIRAHGRVLVTAEVPLPLDGPDTSPATTLMSSIGGRPVNDEVRRTADLSAMTDPTLVELRSGAEAAAAGYSLVSWVDRAPCELLDDLALLISRMSTDPPLGDLSWEPEQWDAARFAARQDKVIASGYRSLLVGARHDATGRLVGFTELRTSPHAPDTTFQWDTIVLEEHRGHRLGMLLKVANLQALRQEPMVPRYVTTWNAAANGHMVAINDALGFAPVERWIEWEAELQPMAAEGACQ